MAAEVRRARMVRRQESPGDFVGRITGRTIRSLRRHGKFLMADLSGDLVWVTHLGMSGRVSLARHGEAESPHTNVVVRVGGGVEMRLVDPRTFGFVVAYTPDELAESPLGRLGPDAYTDLPTVAEWSARLAERTAPIKALLLDQNIVAGLGNIYADEALYRAGIAPHRPGGSLNAGGDGPTAPGDSCNARCGTAMGWHVARRPRLSAPRREGRRVRVTAAGLRQGGRTLPSLRHADPAGRHAPAEHPLVPAVPSLRGHLRRGLHHHAAFHVSHPW